MTIDDPAVLKAALLWARNHIDRGIDADMRADIVDRLDVIINDGDGPPSVRDMRRVEQLYPRPHRMRLSGQTTENDAEIRRLRSWLSYIEGNFRPGSECAEEALRGDPAPEGF